MNITITQDNSRVETLGSNGASIILKLYDLAIDSNNTLTLRGNISTAYAYGDLVDYLNTTYGPDLIVNATNRYISFVDSAVLSALLAAGFGDGTGITETLAAVAELGETFKWNTNITSFPEFKYFTRANTNLSSYTLYFKGCTNLTSIDLSMCEVLTDYEFVDSGLAIDVNAPRLVKAGTQAFGGCNITKISNLGSITSIPSCFCISCNNLTEVTLPSTVTSICPTGYGAFRNCVNLTTVRGLENVTTIGNLAFYQCYPLTFNELYLPNLILLGSSAFFRCNKISKITCLGKLSTINSNAFETSSNDVSSLTEVYLPYECTTLDVSAFNSCKALTTIKLYTQSVDDWIDGETPAFGTLSKITTFSELCFVDCTSLQLTPNDIQGAVTIGNNAFKGVIISGTLNLPNLTLLGDSAFRLTSITSIQSLGSITSIPKYCFENCTSLTNVTLSSSITVIYDNCFSLCPSLEWVKILYTGDNDNPIVGAGTDCFGRTGYSDHNTNIKIFVPDSRVNDYINASWFWNKYSSLIYPLSDFSTYFPNA